jgi:hypothetical protein
VVVTVLLLWRSSLLGQNAPERASNATGILASADFSQEVETETERIVLLRGRCRLVHGETTLIARKMVLWQPREQIGQRTSQRIVVYLEDDVRIDRPGHSASESTAILDLTASGKLELAVTRQSANAALVKDAVYLRAAQRRQAAYRGGLQPTNLPKPGNDAESGPDDVRVVRIQQPTGEFRRVRIYPRSSVPYNVLSFKSKSTPPEQITVLTGGVNLLIDGLRDFETVDLAADRMVIWTEPLKKGEFTADSMQSKETPFQVYLEGNIVIRQRSSQQTNGSEILAGEKVIRASHAFFNAKEDRALLLNAELKTFVPSVQGTIRLRAERLRQLSRDSYHAQQAWATSSEFGRPGYRLQSSDIFLENRYSKPWAGTSAGMIDPDTGAPIVEEVPWLTALNNTFRVGDVPLMYSPYVSVPAEDPNIPLRRASIGNDRIFGTKAETAWSLFKLLGVEQPKGVDWNLLADYYSERGFGLGTDGSYQGVDAFGIPGRYVGRGLLYHIHDSGLDDLGESRRNLVPEKDNRYRARWKHRQDLSNGVKVFGELGLISDRNFLEQYYEGEFDNEKDSETLLYATQSIDNWGWSTLARPQVNDFENTTEWLPRGDMYLLSEPLLDGRMTWSSHSSAGYAHLRPATTPTDPRDIFTPLPYVADAQGAVLMSRHEIDAPFSLGPVNIVPYALGEAAYWGEGFTGSNIDRLLGSAGVRSSMMVWKAFPFVRSRLFNLNGLAHKMLFEAGYAYTDVNQGLSTIPQFNEFDDNSQERFRQHFVTSTFGGTLPAEFSPRGYAVRSGTGLEVTSPYHELVNDQQVARLAWRHRLQTKVGPPGRMRIKDWMTFDMEASYFPKSARDNFGEELGLLGGRYLWNVGDRTSLTASAYYDLFDDAQQLWNFGVFNQRSSRGSVYFGLRQVKGAGLDSQIVSTSYSYQMSPKWVSTLGTSYDLGENRNLGQSATVTRIGADFLFHLGINYNENKDNAGIAFMIQPRFGPFSAPGGDMSSTFGGGPGQR